jgi:hypothetical protein
MDSSDHIIYPVSRLLANPRVFYAIASYFDGPDAETIKDAFYDTIEHKFTEQDLDEIEFDCHEVSFRIDPESGSFEITLDNGVASLLEVIEGEVHAKINNDSEWAAATAIYQRLVMAIEENHPSLVGDIALCSPPTPGNGYLRSEDGERFEGSFHLLSDPEKLYAFNIEIVDVSSDKLQAFIKPIS